MKAARALLAIFLFTGFCAVADAKPAAGAKQPAVKAGLNPAIGGPARGKSSGISGTGLRARPVSASHH